MKYRITKLLAVLIGSISIHCFALNEGQLTPNIEAKTIDGQTFDLMAERGNVVIINFWATWCSPCRAEMPALDEYYKKHKSQNLKVLAISVDDRADENLVKQITKGFSFLTVLKHDANYSDFGSMAHVPMTFVIDRKGIVHRDGNKADPKIDITILEKTVTPLLQEK